MSSEWLSTTIGEQATLQRGYDITKAAQRDGCIPVISSGGTNSYHDSAMVGGPGVVLGRKGVVGSVYYVEHDYWPHDTTLWVKDFHGNSPKFVYYFFLSKAKELAALDVGSANPTLNRNHVHPIKVLWPSLSEQRDIAELLGTLDNRITLLREKNTTLEAIAQTLFKSWFVDFDPVRAKQEGSALEGMDEATATLFPDGFEESELGLVPKGWIAGRFSDVLQETSTRIGTQDAFVLSAIQTGHLVKSEQHFTKRVHSEDISKYKSVAPNAFAYNPSRINIGSIGLNEFGGLGAVSPIYVVLEPLSKSKAYLIWHHLRTNKVKEAIQTLCSGTVRQSLSSRDFCSLPITLPSESVLTVFNEIRKDLYRLYQSTSERCATLESIRDTLLPRLISGQLRLPEAEALVA